MDFKMIHEEITLSYQNFFGFKLSIFAKQELENYIVQCFNSKKSRVFYGYSLGIIAYLKKFPLIYYYSNNFDLMVTDGRLFYLLAKRHHIPVKYDISIPKLVNTTLALAHKYRMSVLLVGSTPENNLLASKNIKKNFTNLRVLPGISGGDFLESDYPQITNHINKYRPSIVLIGVSSPKKEHFAMNCAKVLDIDILIPCGIVIDILAGKINKIPPYIKSLGLGAFWRLVQEPKRLGRRYLFLFKEVIFKIFFIMLFKNPNYFLPQIYKIEPIDYQFHREV